MKGWVCSQPCLISRRLEFDGLMQDCIISIANALEILQACTKPPSCALQPDHSCAHNFWVSTGKNTLKSLHLYIQTSDAANDVTVVIVYRDDSFGFSDILVWRLYCTMKMLFELSFIDTFLFISWPFSWRLGVRRSNVQVPDLPSAQSVIWRRI